MLQSTSNSTKTTHSTQLFAKETRECRNLTQQLENEKFTHKETQQPTSTTEENNPNNAKREIDTPTSSNEKGPHSLEKDATQNKISTSPHPENNTQNRPVQITQEEIVKNKKIFGKMTSVSY